VSITDLLNEIPWILVLWVYMTRC